MEAHIQAELSTSPPAASRKVGVPPKQISRGAVAIPKRVAYDRERHVHIFESQPLSSPSPRSSSPIRHSLQLSRISSVQSTLSAVIPNSKPADKPKVPSTGERTPDLSEGSSGSWASSLTSTAAASSVGTVLSTDTVATSIDSLPRIMSKLSIAGSKTCPCLLEESLESCPGKPEVDLHHPHLRVQTGPSLLSQTAPQSINQRHTSASCPYAQEPVASCSYSPPAPLSQPSEVSLTLPSLPSVAPPPPAALPISIKIADLGNATPTTQHYTEDIQTRQYRSPEAILGRTDWGATADVWSAACVIFELLTAEYLFDPQSQSDVFGKDDDHMAQIIELLGDFDPDMKFGGRYSREIFDSNGASSFFCSFVLSTSQAYLAGRWDPGPRPRSLSQCILYFDSIHDLGGIDADVCALVAFDRRLEIYPQFETVASETCHG